MSAPALEVRGLRKSFGGIAVTQNVNLTLQPGERRLIIGPNGAGKTTLFGLVSGEIRPDAGSIRLFGDEVSGLPVSRRAHLGMSRTYQIVSLFPNDSLLHNVVLGLMALQPLRRNPWRRLARCSELHDRAHELLRSVGLAEKALHDVNSVSYGEQRRVELALGLAQNPRLLLLDEPLAGLSRDERALVQELIAHIPRSTAILMIEHDMDVALAFAETITVLHYGSVIVDGDRATVTNDPKTKEVYLGH